MALGLPLGPQHLAMSSAGQAMLGPETEGKMCALSGRF